MASRLESYLLEVIAEPSTRKGSGPAALRSLLAGCSRLYDLGLDAYLAGERWGLRRRGSLPIPVISIGNLSVGGTGKTPMTQMICRGLLSRGHRIAVLSRGHGGSDTGTQVVSTGNGEVALDTAHAGDEPVLLARSLPAIPVLTGKDRRLSGREALRRFALDALVLDDGFQYWQLARDLDIVLIDAARPFDNGYSLPRGLLRESKRHLNRAGLVVATRADRITAAQRADLARYVDALAPGRPLFYARHQPVELVDVHNLGTTPLSGLFGMAIAAVSAIADPTSFHALLEGLGARIVHSESAPDHSHFSAERVKEIGAQARLSGAHALVMTEKDAVKWNSAREPEIPEFALRIEMKVEEEDLFFQQVLQRAFGKVNDQ